MSVRWVALHEVATLNREAHAVQAEQTYRPLGLLNRGRGVFERPPIKGSDTKYAHLYRAHPGQLVFSKLFAWEGSVAVIPASMTDHYVSSEFPTFDLDVTKVDTRYIHHLIGWEGLVSQLSNATTGMGQRRQRVNIDAFEAAQIPLPPLAEQRRLADHLDALDRSVETTRRAAMDRHWRAVIEQTAGMSEPAVRVELHQILTARSTHATSPDAEYRMAGVYSFGRGLLDRSTIRGHETKYTTMTQLNTGDVVFSKLGAFEGAVAVVSPEFDGAHVSPEFPVFAVSAEFDPAYLRYCFIAASFVDQLNSATSGVGARQKRVAPRRFLELTVPSRPLDEQRQLVSHLDKLTRAVKLAGMADGLAAAVLPAARNEIFSSMR